MSSVTTRGSMSVVSTNSAPPADTKGSDVPLKRLYIRQFSNILRKWSSYGELNMTENAVFNIIGPNRTIIITICRIRQRILAQAWSTWAKNTGVQHDYENDVHVILSRKLPEGDLRTELEVEVLYKWMAQVKDMDPTGIASTIYNCKKKAVIYEALQQIRLEFFAPGDTVLFQGDIPRSEDGHFTIFRGECEVVQFPEESVPLLKLLYLAKKKKWDEGRRLLNSGQVVAKIPKLSGFGELSTLTGVKRAATIRAARKLDYPTEILVLPKDALLDCLKSRLHDGVAGSAPSEAIDFLRQSGLANRISPKDLVTAAGCMIRRTLLQGDVLYYKGETVSSIFLVVSGEFLLDTADCIVDGQLQPFVNSNIDKCCHLSSGSILGDEGVTGQNNAFESTAAVVSSAAVVFEAVGFGMRFLADKLGSLRYSALFYRDKLRFDDSYALAEQMNLYTYFNSLRKCIAFTKPFRGLSQTGDERPPARPKSTQNHSRSPSPKSSPNRLYQKVIEDRNKALQQRDTRVSFFLESNMSTESDSISRPGSPSLNSYSGAPRVLVGVGLHRALEFNKQAKKVLQNSIKIHAKDSILYEQLRKLPKEEGEDEAAVDAERALAEKAFKKALKEYFERVAERNRRIKEEEEAERQRKLAKGGSAIKFFASTVSEDEYDENDSRGKLSKQGSQASIKSGSSAGLSRGGSEASLTKEREQGMSKMEQYFLWVDKLNRANYRYLLQQAQITADSLHDQQIHETSNATVNDDASFSAESWKELAEVFQTFGLTPSDMNIPWEQQRKSAEFNRKSAEFNRGATPKTPALPLERLNSSPIKTSSERDLLQEKEDAEKVAQHKAKHQAGGTFGTQRRAVIPIDAHGSAMLRNDRDAKLIECRSKGYTPSSWRDDMIQKKAQELATEVIKFMRADTPDNRRVMGIHIVVSNHEEDQPHTERDADGHPSDRAQPVKTASNFSQFMHEINYEQYIDSPDYFMKIVFEMDLDHQRRMPVNSKPWQTRFMVIVNDPNANKTKKKTGEGVRTHLKENLDQFSKSALMENVQKLKDKQVTPFIRTINKEQWAPEEIAAISRKDSFLDTDAVKASFLSKSIRMSQSLTTSSSANTIQTSLMQVREAMSMDYATDGSAKVASTDEGKFSSKLGISIDVDPKLPNIQGSPKHSGTPKLAHSPKKRTYALPDLPAAAQQRISDVKAPSKALQAFEEFLKTQQTGTNKAAIEGKKRANKTSKFKLHKSEDNYLEQVSLAGVHRMKFDTELRVFRAMYPNATRKQIDEFVKTFLVRYPDVKLGHEFQHLQEDHLALDFMSVTSTSQSLSSSHGSYNSIEVGATKLKRAPSPQNRKITFNLDEDQEDGGGSLDPLSKRDDSDPDLEQWQSFTIDSIVKSKVGERKTLPGVSCKALEKGLSGKRYRSNRAQRGGSGTLVTIPAKSTEEPIDGPPNYLDLYKTCFRLHTSSTEKAKVLEELRAKSASNSRGGF